MAIRLNGFRRYGHPLISPSGYHPIGERAWRGSLAQVSAGSSLKSEYYEEWEKLEDDGRNGRYASSRASS